ncbi:Tubulin-tyrosine ligase family protein [Tritrichomonas foetus]|uniref:Tubulin-tyrosine ligase family protein n=1 Tax=Tritrichomonas foetus TaxID=1144522 RepID=A0A1J4JU50_9EUKA|nr:Tubulin-tyrosine ligase family protein [Tritrichomonas foetus]|eukprot:OHT01044.1 Tubulin-tyrosine ligase family protein [Tritrichomonas foetus]
MLNHHQYLIFHPPSSIYETTFTSPSDIKCNFKLGSYNKRLVSKILSFNGLTPSNNNEFTLMWGSSPDTDEIVPISVYQKLNHFPYSKRILGNKAELAFIIQKHPHILDFPRFFPRTFILPADRDNLYRHMKMNPNQPFISKPAGGSCGHGIKIVKYADFYSIPTDYVVSEYIQRPLCIDGFKFDLRIYVLVTSFAPLRAFVYREGLARFATESYSNISQNVYSHLTNATLNKHSQHWNSQFKWKLSEALHEIEHRFNRSCDEVMQLILDTVARTLALVQHVMAPNERRNAVDPFFELFGFDLLLDRNFKMWLIEINTFPSLGFDEDVDFEVKAPLVAQALSIAGIPNLRLKDLPTRCDVSPENIDKIDQEIIRGEDKRNEASGNGFIRIFPHAATQDLQPLLTVPRYIGKVVRKKRPENIHPTKIGKLLTSDQSMDLLLCYLSKIYKDISNDQASKVINSRVAAFLSAQGYQINKNWSNLSIILKNYIKRQRAKAALSTNYQKLPDDVKDKILDSGDEFIGQAMLNTNLKVKNVRSLFY